jgi:hypothetical protein
MKAIAISILSILVCTVGAFARLGETLERCEERYGPIVEEQKSKNAPPLECAFVFTKNEFKITVRLLNGRVGWILYTSPKPIVRETIDGLLDNNSEGSKWTTDEAATKQEQSAVMRKTIVYKRQDGGAEGKYQEIGSYNGLLIMSSAFRKAISPELNGL